MTTRSAMPMFPLGTVLLPGGLIPLHVFEPRYRDMVRDCLRDDGDPEFGQVLITRGREAGGGDERAMVGTVAQMVQVDALDENRYAFLAVGTRRITVERWLTDDPYPRADVSDWPDVEVPGDDLHEALTRARTRVERVVELGAAVAEREGASAPMGSDQIGSGLEGFDPGADPVLASYHLATLAPLGPSDRHRLLSSHGPRERLLLLDEILDDVEAMLEFRLS